MSDEGPRHRVEHAVGQIQQTRMLNAFDDATGCRQPRDRELLDSRHMSRPEVVAKPVGHLHREELLLRLEVPLPVHQQVAVRPHRHLLLREDVLHDALDPRATSGHPRALRALWPPPCCRRRVVQNATEHGRSLRVCHYGQHIVKAVLAPRRDACESHARRPEHRLERLPKIGRRLMDVRVGRHVRVHDDDGLAARPRDSRCAH